jgi:hypothetical protein
MIRLALILLWLVPLVGVGQQFEWVHTLGGSGRDAGNYVLIDNEGNLWVAGSFTDTSDFAMGPDTYALTSNGGSDAFVAKYTPNGELIWVKQFGGIYDYDEANYLALTPDGHVLVTGRFFGPLDFDPGPDVYSLEGDEAVFILKLDYDGNFIWVRHYENFEGNSYPKGTQCDADGNIYVVGDFAGPVDFDPSPTDTFTILSYECWRAFITKMTPNGDLMWAKYFGGYSPWQDTHLTELEIDASGTLFLVGRAVIYATIDLDPGPDTLEVESSVFLSTFDEDGNLLSGVSLNNMGVSAIELDSIGNIYLSGEFSNTVDFDLSPNEYALQAHPGTDAFVAKYNQSMDLIWVKQLSSERYSAVSAHEIRLNSTQQTITLGGIFSGTCDFNPDTVLFPLYSSDEASPYLCKLDTSGNFHWVKQFRTLDETQYYYSNSINSIVLDPNDDIYSVGKFVSTTDFDTGLSTDISSPLGYYDCFIHKLSNCNGITYGQSTDTTCYFTAPENQVAWGQSGIYQYAIPNAVGCDSIITLNLTTFNNTGSTNVTACDHFDSPSGNFTWTTNGTFIDTIANSFGCDSVLTIGLSILESTDTSVQRTACGLYTSPSGNYQWTNSGTYVDVLQNMVGCDSVIAIDLTVIHVDVSVSVNLSSISLSANASDASYQWLDCNNGSEPIAAANSQTFVPTQSGHYAVVVSANGCTDTSACFGLIGIGIEETLAQRGFAMYPNPATDRLYMEALPNAGPSSITMHDAAGRIVMHIPFTPLADVSALAPGTYLVTLQTEQGMLRQNLIKQ